MPKELNIERLLHNLRRTSTAPSRSRGLRAAENRGWKVSRNQKLHLEDTTLQRGDEIVRTIASRDVNRKLITQAWRAGDKSTEQLRGWGDITYIVPEHDDSY